MSFPSTHFSSDIHQFKAQGKLLLSGEYFVLDGALALALPTKLGQQLSLSSNEQPTSILHWKSLTVDGNCWFEGRFDLSDLKIFNSTDTEVAKRLQGILEKARELNPAFLPSTSNHSLQVETSLEFPRQWGLGSSSTLISNISTWAKVDPYQLLAHSFGGSGYDLACAGATGPILYQKEDGKSKVYPCTFDPPFKEQLYFVYLEKKQNSRQGIARYRAMIEGSAQQIDFISGLSKKFLEAKDLNVFEQLIEQHENFIAQHLQLDKAKDVYFPDFWGSVKSLGAWGGDFVLVSSNRGLEHTKSYFSERGFQVFIPYTDLILERT